jgi:hypothetical protein
MNVRLANGKPTGDAVVIYRRTANLGFGTRDYFYVMTDKSITLFTRTSQLPYRSAAEGTAGVVAIDALTGAQVALSGTYKFHLAVTDQGSASPDSFAVKITASKGGAILYEAGMTQEVGVTGGDFTIRP